MTLLLIPFLLIVVEWLFCLHHIVLQRPRKDQNKKNSAISYRNVKTIYQPSLNYFIYQWFEHFFENWPRSCNKHALHIIRNEAIDNLKIASTALIHTVVHIKEDIVESEVVEIMKLKTQALYNFRKIFLLF